MTFMTLINDIYDIYDINECQPFKKKLSKVTPEYFFYQFFSKFCFVKF